MAATFPSRYMCIRNITIYTCMPSEVIQIIYMNAQGINFKTLVGYLLHTFYT